MNKILKLSRIAIIFLMVFISCKNDVLTPNEMLVGKWMITSKEILGVEIPGDGSYLIFNACSQTCAGTD